MSHSGNPKIGKKRLFVILRYAHHVCKSNSLSGRSRFQALGKISGKALK